MHLLYNSQTESKKRALGEYLCSILKKVNVKTKKYIRYIFLNNVY